MTPLQSKEKDREPESAASKRVLVIDDEKVMLSSCQKILEKTGYRVETYDNGQEGIARFRQSPPPLLIVDLKMPDIDGLQVIERVREIDPQAVIVVITGYATVGAAVEAMKAGAYDFLPKPFTPDELRLIVNRGYERWHLARESQILRREKEEIQRNFITLVSHQLKSPLAAVRQCLDALEFLAKDELSAEATEFITRAQARTDELLATIKDWLTLSKLKRGAKCNECDSVELANVIDQVVHSFSQQAETAGVDLEVHANDGLPKVRGDAACVGVLIANLLSNAIKYNRPGGSAEIRANCDQESIELKVIDTGIGISEKGLPRLFSEFYRIKTEKTENISGTGLGLTICKAIVEELGGSIEASNNETEGCTFTVRLPTVPADNPRSTT